MVVVVIVVVVVVVEDNCRKHSRKMSDKSDSTTAERMNGRTNRSKVVVAVPTVVTAVMNSKFGFP